jgi:hypothetical protein
MDHCVEIASRLRRSHKYALTIQSLGQANPPFKTLLLEQVPRLSACLLSTLYLFDQVRAGMHRDTDRKDPLTFPLEVRVRNGRDEAGLSGHPLPMPLPGWLPAAEDDMAASMTTDEDLDPLSESSLQRS